MKVSEYTDFVTARCEHFDKYVDFNYCVIALNEEAGEIAGWYKKAGLRGNRAYTDEMLKSEMGDVLFYLTAMATIFGWTLKELMQANVDKLAARKASGGSDRA